MRVLRLVPGRPRFRSVVVETEPARGRRPCEPRRLHDRGRECKDRSFAIGHHAWAAAGLGRDRGRGSGNPETPCWRMHRDPSAASPASVRRGASSSRRQGDRRGRSFWHFACAALNAGDEGSAPVRYCDPPPVFGSGKLGTPLGAHALGERDHRLLGARLAFGRRAAALRSLPTQAPLGRGRWWRDAGAGGLPPHPATRTPLRSAAAASRRARGGGEPLGV